jgi:hypothetical protein
MPLTKVNADRPAESCRIVRADFRPERVIEGMDAARAAARLIAATFPGASENAVCIAAARALGVSENTIRAILRCQTKDASWRVMSRCMVFLAAQGKDPLAVIGNAALTQLMRGAFAGGAL